MEATFNVPGGREEKKQPWPSGKFNKGRPNKGDAAGLLPSVGDVLS